MPNEVACSKGEEELELYLAAPDQRQLCVEPLYKDTGVYRLTRPHRYVHNPSSLAAVAIMATTPSHEAQMTRDILYLHLSRRPEVKVRIPVRHHSQLSHSYSLSAS